MSAEVGWIKQLAPGDLAQAVPDAYRGDPGQNRFTALPQLL